MTEPESPVIANQDTAEPAPRPRSFSRLVTLVCSIVVAVYIGLPLGPLIQQSGSPLDQLDRPEDSLERLVTRELDLGDAMRSGWSWEWQVYRFLSGGGDPLREALAWYEELIDTADSPSAELHLAILRAESGEPDHGHDAATQWKTWGEAGERLGGWVAAAYLEPPPDADSARAVIFDIRDERTPDWFTDTLATRIAARIGDAGTSADAHAAIIARGRTLQRRLRLLTVVVIALLAVGMVLLVKWLARRAPLRVADAAVPPNWSFGDGYALFVRALGAPQAIMLLTYFLLRRDTPWDTPLGMVADLPIAWWVVGYLRSRQASVADTFGLLPPRRTWLRLAATTVVLIAVALLADTLIDVIGGLVGLRSHWADGFSEDILWHPRWWFALDCLNVTIWAPMVEELTFRGLLYATLRTRLAVAPAAFVSAALFALPHGYAVSGSLSVLVSGLLWAWAYERTRSLLPGLLAHSANNLMSTVWVVGLLRW